MDALAAVLILLVLLGVCVLAVKACRDMSEAGKGE